MVQGATNQINNSPGAENQDEASPGTAGQVRPEVNSKHRVANKCLQEDVAIHVETRMLWWRAPLVHVMIGFPIHGDQVEFAITGWAPRRSGVFGGGCRGGKGHDTKQLGKCRSEHRDKHIYSTEGAVYHTQCA